MVICSRGQIVTEIVAWCCKAHKTKASVKIRMLDLLLWP